MHPASVGGPRFLGSAHPLDRTLQGYLRTRQSIVPRTAPGVPGNSGGRRSTRRRSKPRPRRGGRRRPRPAGRRAPRRPSRARTRTRRSGRARRRAGRGWPAGARARAGPDDEDLGDATRARASTSQPRPRLERRGVDQRADGDEEEDREQVAEREQPLACLPRDGALSDRQARDERRERERDAGQNSAGARHGEARGDGHRQEEVGFAPKPGEHPRQEECRRDGDAGERGEAEQRDVRRLPCAEGGEQDDRARRRR